MDSSIQREWAIPGEKVGHANEYCSGSGTYEFKKEIYASAVGYVEIASASSSGSVRSKPVISVRSDREVQLVPKIGDVVIGKVTRVTRLQAHVEILCIGSNVLKHVYRGVIRKQDVRMTEVDKVEIYKSFRPTDVVRADVISLGDARSFYLSTAKNELGVVYAQSLAGATMVPVSWQEMQCPVTKSVESRKVAKLA